MEQIFMIISGLTAALILPVFSINNNDECGPYGFKCIGGTKLRLCDAGIFYGPIFLCPGETICNDYSRKVCEDSATYINPLYLKTGKISCQRNQRLPDPSVPNCKGYILCVQKRKTEYDLLKFKCGGSTTFNPSTSACTSPRKFVCPEKKETTVPSLYVEENRKYSSSDDHLPQKSRNEYSIDCKNYRFSVDSDNEEGNKVAYFCPKKPPPGFTTFKCTVFSNRFCVMLELDKSTYQSRRNPRIGNIQ